MQHRVVPVSVFVLCLALAPWSWASRDESDGTRAEELLAQRRARLAEVEPAPDSAFIRILTTFENDGFDQLVTMQAGDFRFGFGKISPSSGATPTIQYERPRLGSTPLTLRTAAAYSIRSYQAYALQLGVFDNPIPYPFEGTGFLGAPFGFDNRSVAPLDTLLYLDAHYRRFSKEEFFGLGPGSSNADRSRYSIDDGEVDLVTGYQPFRWLALTARGGWLRLDTDSGGSNRFPDTEMLFTPDEAPGLGEGTNFLRTAAGVYVTWAGDPNLPALELEVEGTRHADRDGGQYSFNRCSIDARGFLPLGSRQRVIAVRVFASRDRADAGAQVPFYLMNTLGGHDTLRGFRDYRFRDENVLFLSGEYRWEATAGLALAIFYDTGKVFDDPSAFGLDHLRHTVGFGIRGKSLRRTVFRLDIGKGDEGTRLFVAFGPAF
ncbi:MAG: BamA/TamA family outer membrane protein [Acidobacteriota bacterium]|nr:BamA/TamA family outer membrane protein [Acidobacteriota bacterium]